MKLGFEILCLCLLNVSLYYVTGFAVIGEKRLKGFGRSCLLNPSKTLFFTKDDFTEKDLESMIENSNLSKEDVTKVGNLVADDEWMGLR